MAEKFKVIWLMTLSSVEKRGLHREGKVFLIMTIESLGVQSGHIVISLRSSRPFTPGLLNEVGSVRGQTAARDYSS